MTDGNYIFGKINNRSVRILVDTGANPNVIDMNVVRQLGIKINRENGRSKLFTANAGQMPVLGTANFDIKIRNLNFPVEAKIVDHLTDKIILGRNFLTTYNCIINYADNSLTIDHLMHAALENAKSRMSKICSVKTINLKPNSSTVILVRAQNSMVNRDVLIKEIPGRQFQKFGLQRFLIHPNRNIFPCRILNFRPDILTINKHEIVGQILPITEKDCIKLHDDADVQKFNKFLANSHKKSAEVSQTLNTLHEVTDVTISENKKKLIDDFINEFHIDINSEL